MHMYLFANTLRLPIHSNIESSIKRLKLKLNSLMSYMTHLLNHLNLSVMTESTREGGIRDCFLSKCMLMRAAHMSDNVWQCGTSISIPKISLSRYFTGIFMNASFVDECVKRIASKSAYHFNSNFYVDWILQLNKTRHAQWWWAIA